MADGNSDGTQTCSDVIAASFTRLKSSAPEPSGCATGADAAGCAGTGGGLPLLRCCALASSIVACKRLSTPSSIGRTSSTVSGYRLAVKVKNWRPQNTSRPMSLLLLVSVLPCTMMCTPLPLGEYSVKLLHALMMLAHRSVTTPVPGSMAPSISMPINPSSGRKANPMPLHPPRS